MSKITGFRISVIFLGTVVFLSGCGEGNISYIDIENLPFPVLFERVSSGKAHITEVYAYEDGDGLVIYGKIKRTAKNCCDHLTTGDILIEIVDTDGLVLDTIETGYNPVNIPRSRRRSSSFRTRLDYIPPEDIKVRVVHRSL